MKYEIIDDFLSEQDYTHLNDLLFFPNGDSKLLLRYSADVNGSSKPDQFYFARIFVNNKVEEFEGSTAYIDPIMYELKRRINRKLLVSRAKLNLFTRTQTNIGMGMHVDLDDTNTYETIIYYVNDNNGGTRFGDGTFIEQKKNRALIIYGQELHESVTQTDTNIRVNINVNYWRV